MAYHSDEPRPGGLVVVTGDGHARPFVADFADQLALGSVEVRVLALSSPNFTSLPELIRLQQDSP